jgi:hypothetical protein
VNTTELSELLRDATDGLEPPRDFARHVLAGGRRRRLRRRLTVVASAVAVAAAATTGTVVALDADPGVDTAENVLSAPTQGDLAGDRAFLNQVVRVWDAELPLAEEARMRFYDDPRGDPHVLWAGNTPAGRAAVVVQQVYLHRDYWVRASWSGMRMAKGLIAIDPADGKLKLLGTWSPLNAPEAVTYFRFGPEDRTMLIVDEGKPLYYSSRPNDADPNGNVGNFRPDWHRVQARDGVALVSITDRLDSSSGRGQVQRILAYQGDHPPAVVTLDTASVANSDPASGYLHDRLDSPEDRVPLPNYFRWQDTWTFGTPVDGLDLDWVENTIDDRIHSAWRVVVWLPDRVLVVKETMIDHEKSEFDSNGSVLTVGIGRIKQGRFDVDLVDVARVDHDAVLPIKYHIPDGGGWVVVQKEKALSYRTQGGQWQDAGRDAALLPDNAVEVKVGDKAVTL